MKNFLINLARQLLRRTGADLLNAATAELQKHIEKHDAAIEQTRTEVFARADESDKLREKIDANRALNIAATEAIRVANDRRDRLSNLING